MANLFLGKSKYKISKYDPYNSWTDAYQTPVLLLGENALEYNNELSDFIPATKFCLIKNDNELSFVIHKNLDILKDSIYYNLILNLGFVEEICLGNRRFIDYIDENQKSIAINK